MSDKIILIKQARGKTIFENVFLKNNGQLYTLRKINSDIKRHHILILQSTNNLDQVLNYFISSYLEYHTPSFINVFYE